MQLPHIVWQAAARAKQAEVPTQPDAGDPLGSQYGDAGLVRSEGISGRVWTRVDTLTPELKDQKVSIGYYSSVREWQCRGPAS
jgi:hypothetical protein